MTIPISKAEFCAIDVETTGLSSLSRIVEIGAVRFRIGEHGDHFQTLVDPGCSIPPAVTRIHGITNEMVKGAPDSREALRSLTGFIEGCVLVAHNASFDTRMIGSELVRAGMRMPDNDVICTIKTTKRLMPKMPNYRLKTLVEQMGIEVEGYHRALSDARAAKQIFEIAVTSRERWRDGDLDFYVERCSSDRLGECVDGEGPVPAELEEVGRAIGEAIDTACEVIITYQGEKKAPWTRQVKPVNMFSLNGNHYLEVQYVDGSQRNLRLDRIKSFLTRPAE